MYLKSLVIKGFKSFADRSVVNFEPGISVIVGPNGSGKSNVSEAVQWVLGEMNPRNLRVQSLEELIFSGSSARGAVSLAEVELVLDNSDSTLAIEFDQVALMRRMYRSGESEYFINGAPCRRMDIIDILFDSGIGQGAHSIIGQGNLTAVLESRPEDRRMLIEEAAGVLKHKKRKEKARRKLDAMDVSLQRVKDIIKIIESQLRPLERQAKRASQHAEIAEELRDLDLALMVDDLRSLQSEWNELGKQEHEIEAEIELAHLSLSEKEAELANRQRTLEEKGLFVGDLNEQRLRCHSIIQQLDAGMRLLEEKGKNMVERLSDLRATIHNSQTKLADANEQLNQVQTSVVVDEGQMEALYARFNELTHESEAALKKLRDVEQEHSQATSSLRNRESALEQTKAKLVKTQDSLKSLDLEQELFGDSLAQLELDFANTQNLLTSKRARLDVLDGTYAKSNNDAELAKSEIDKFVRLLDTKRTLLETQREETSQLRAEIAALEEVSRALENSSAAVNTVMENLDTIGTDVSPVAAAFKVSPAAKLPFGASPQAIEHLIETLLGSDLFSLIVKDSDSQGAVAKYVLSSKEASGALSLIPASGGRIYEGKPSHGHKILDFIEVPEQYELALQTLLGDVFLVDTVTDAQKAHRRDRTAARFVSMQGVVVWPSGKLTMGIQLNDVEGVLDRKRRLDNANDELERRLNVLSEAEYDFSLAQANLAKAQQDGFELSQSSAKLQGDRDALRDELIRLEESLTSMIARREQTAAKLADVQSRRQTSAPLAGEFELRIAALKSESDDLSKQSEYLSEQLSLASERRNKASEALASCKIEIEGAKSKAIFIHSRRETLQREIKELGQVLDVSQSTQASLSTIRLRIDPLYKIYEELHDGASTWAQRLKDQALLEQTDSSNLRSVIKNANEAVDSARNNINQINLRLTEIRVTKGRLESDVRHAIEQISINDDISLEDALKIPTPEDRQQAVEQAGRLRKRLAGIGTVNLMAAEEYESLRERRDYLLNQIEDLHEARKSLARIDGYLDRKMRNQFLETFEVVNTNFQEIFAILFPGGAGQLVLTEGETSDENGVEVNAQPRGKKLTKLSLMSGGEKSLVALALLFSIYRIRRVPFYILDEVEAALDDSNLKRLLEYLDHMRPTTQLVLVSHQRRTMEMADVLYGVSMQAAGVSKLVSQRLDQALAHAGSPEGVQ